MLLWRSFVSLRRIVPDYLCFVKSSDQVKLTTCFCITASRSLTHSLTYLEMATSMYLILFSLWTNQTKHFSTSANLIINFRKQQGFTFCYLSSGIVFCVFLGSLNMVIVLCFNIRQMNTISVKGVLLRTRNELSSFLFTEESLSQFYPQIFWYSADILS